MFLSIGANILLAIIKLLYLAKRLIAAFFVYCVIAPGRFILRFLFYKIAVVLYMHGLSLVKKMGWSKLNDSFFSFLFNQKLVHVLVVIVSCLLIFINLSGRTKAYSQSEAAGNTILWDLIMGGQNGSGQDGQLVVETFDQEQTISFIQQKYLDELSVLKSEPGVAVEEGEDEEMATIQEGSSVIKPDIVSTKITKRPREKEVIYTVKPGDTISTIAEEYEVSVNTILWENKLSVYSIIRPGDNLVILPVSGIRHTIAKGENLTSIAKKYKIEEGVILSANKLADASLLTVGGKLMIPGGAKVYVAPAAPRAYTGISAITDLVKSPGAKPAPGNKMNWPTVGYKITQYFSWRHNAVDIANKAGTPIYAADSGTIGSIGWGSGYGNQILIDHGGGKKTRYAHLSKFYVTKGQKVSKGEAIGAMGSTGWSTGSHLHFEVIINGVKYNPLNYIK